MRVILLQALVCGGDELLDPDEAADEAAALDLLVDGSLKCDLDEAAALNLLVDGSLKHDLDEAAAVLWVGERDLWHPTCFKLGFSIGEAGIID